jgi:hypothetical protein
MSKNGDRIPESEVLLGFVQAGKTVDWICEKWNVTPQTVRAWFKKFNLSLPRKQSTKTSYRKKAKFEEKDCPICQQSQNVNYLATERHWYCMNCDTEFDQNNVIYIYDDKGDLIEVIASRPGIWEGIKIGKAGKGLIRTVTV